MPKVTLSDDEYCTGITTGIKGHDPQTQIFITAPAFIAAFPAMRNEYVKVGNNCRLYSTDADGNVKRPTCFYLPGIAAKNKTQ